MVNGECLGDLGAPHVKGSVSLMMNEGTRIGTICEERDASPLTGAPDPAGATGRSGAPRPVPHLTHRPRPESRPAPRRYRRVALAWAALALLGLLAHPEPALAQTVTLVSNTGQSTANIASSLQSQPFTTGDNSGGYTLTSVEVGIADLGRANKVVHIVPNASSGQPDLSDATKFIVLTAPATYAANALNTFTAPASATLAANTTYHVHVSNAAALGGHNVQRTSSNAEDSGGATGWSIGNTRYWRNSSSDSWSTSTSAFVKIKINGTITAPPNNAPTVATAIPDQTATAGTAFSYAFPDTTFNDADIGQTLSYMATKADGMALPTWLAFTAGTRTFAGTPPASDVGTVSVKVTASDSNGGSVSDEFDITVQQAADTTTATLTKAFIGTGGHIIQIEFSENVQRSNLPPASVFTVTAGGTAVTVSDVASSGAPQNALWLIPSPTIRQGQTVVVTYTDPTAGDDTNAIQDTAGNDAASFTTGSGGVPAVTTGSTVAATTVPGAPTSLTATASGNTQINLSWTAPADNGGSAITGYKIEISSDSGSSWTDQVADTDSGDTLASVKITRLLTASGIIGTLSVDGTPIVAADLPKAVSKADIDAGKLTFTPAANENGPERFKFKVNDGTDDSVAERFMTVQVASVNDAPVVTNEIPNQSAVFDTTRGSRRAAQPSSRRPARRFIDGKTSIFSGLRTDVVTVAHHAGPYAYDAAVLG